MPARAIAIVGVMMAVTSGIAAYEAYGAYGQHGCVRVHRVYDASGKLTLLIYDANGNGQFDTRAYMEGSRLTRREVDENEDGLIDRLEHYTADEKLHKVELSTQRDGRLDRTEWYEDGAIARVDRAVAP